jgi:hypothetical protein
MLFAYPQTVVSQTVICKLFFLLSLLLSLLDSCEWQALIVLSAQRAPMYWRFLDRSPMMFLLAMLLSSIVMSDITGQRSCKRTVGSRRSLAVHSWHSYVASASWACHICMHAT